MPIRQVRLLVRMFVLGLALGLAAVVLAGCGGDGGTTDSSGPDQPDSAAASPRPTRTASIYQATWTPVPSPTPLAHKTIAYTYVPPPTGTPIFLPTPVPTQIPPTFDALAATAQAAAGLVQSGASSNTALLLSARALNEEAATVLGPVIGGFIEGPPEITFDEDAILVAMIVLVRGGDGTTSTRPVILEASASPADDAIRLTKEEAMYSDDDSAYDDPIGDFVLGSIDTALNNVLGDRYRQSNPGGGPFTVVAVQVAADGITVRTDASTN